MHKKLLACVLHVFLCLFHKYVFVNYFLEKRAEKLREKAAANGHSPSHLARVQEELAEFYLSNGDEVVTPELNGFYSADHANNAKKLGKHLEVVHENEQQPGAAETVSPRGTTATMTSDDENDEFYDASSEFNDSPRNLTLTTAANGKQHRFVRFFSTVVNLSPAGVHGHTPEFVPNGHSHL